MDKDPNIEKLKQVDSLSWCTMNNLKLSDGVPFTLAGRPYLIGLVGCDKKRKSIKKGSQVCITTAMFLNAVHGCFYRIYGKNIIYMLPTVKQAEMLSKVSFDPIFNYNKWLNKVVSTNNASIKTINGRSIVFVGAQSENVGNTKDSINLRSIPADVVFRDEIDLMDPDMVDLSKQRLNASDFRIECNFGSPTAPDYGIDELYEDGDKRRWEIKCRSCGHYTCLVESFPKSIIRDVNKRWFRACDNCHSEIFINDGDWVALNPDARDASFWVDGLINPKADLEEYMYRYHHIEGRKLVEFERSVLGLASIEASCRLSEQEVLDKCSNHGMKFYSDSPTCMGVDVGDKLHYVVGRRTGLKTYSVEHIGTTSEFGEVVDISRKMNVKFEVWDKGPDIHAVKEYQREAGHSVFRCQYSENMMTAPDFDREKRIVKVNRNELCDRVHDLFANNKVVLPRRCPDIEEYALQMTKLIKETVPHPDTGIPRTRWIKIKDKNDHFFHATGYFLLAASQTTPVSANGQRKTIKLSNNFHL